MDITYAFQGREYPLVFTANALFAVYDKFGTEGTVADLTHYLDDTSQGFSNACWLAALLAAQGELRRRNLGEDPQPMLTPNQLRLGLMPADIPAFRLILASAVNDGFRTYLEPPEQEQQEVDLVLQELEDTAKKPLARCGVESILRWLHRGSTTEREMPSS